MAVVKTSFKGDMARTVTQRPDMWHVVQWALHDGKRTAVVTCHYIKGRGADWRNGQEFPIEWVEVRKFFKWWREGRFS